MRLSPAAALRIVGMAICLWLALVGYGRADSTRIILDCDRAATGAGPADWCFHISSRSTPSRDGLQIMIAHFNPSLTIEVTLLDGNKTLRRCVGNEVYLCTYTWPKNQMQATEEFTVKAVMNNGTILYHYGKLKRP